MHPTTGVAAMWPVGYAEMIQLVSKFLLRFHEVLDIYRRERIQEKEYVFSLNKI